MRRIRAWAAHHPLVVDAGLAGLVAALLVPGTAEGGGLTGAGVAGAGWLWFAAIHIPLVWRRRAPAVVFWVVLGLVGVSDLIDVTGVFQIFVPLVAGYAVARHRPQRHLWPAVGAFALAVGLAWLRDDQGWQVLVQIFSILAATTLLGVTMRTRRAYLAERARRLEREREQQTRLAVAAERSRITREVHDIVAHNLTVMIALADGAAFTAAAARSVDTGPEKTGAHHDQRAADTMEQVAMTGRQALSEMRRLLGLLREGSPPAAGSVALAPHPGLDDLDRLVDQVRAAGVRVAVTREGVPGAWGPGAGLAVYRIVQEALTNTLKHAGPRASAQVRLSYTTSAVDVEVIDDGAGHSATPPRADGHGLAGMDERVTSYGGHVEAGPAPGAGWRVRAILRFDQNVVA